MEGTPLNVFDVDERSIQSLTDAIPSPETDEVNKFLSQTFNGSQTSEGLIVNSAPVALIIGARRLLSARAAELFQNRGFDGPIKGILMHRIADVIQDQEQRSGSKSYPVERLSSEQSTVQGPPTVTLYDGVISNPRSAVQVVDMAIEELVGSDDPEFAADGTFSRVQLDLLRRIHPGFEEPTDLNYTNRIEPRAELKFEDLWNGYVSEVLNDRLQGLVNDPENSDLTQAERGQILDQINVICDPSNKFALLSPYKLQQLASEADETIMNQILNFRLKRRQKIKISDVGAKPLSESDIQDILNIIRYPGYFQGFTDIIQNNVRKSLEKQLRRVEIEESLVEQLKLEIRKKFQNALIRSGAAVGLICAQTLGEYATQAGLRSFHHAGSTGDTGFDRIASITENPKVPKNPYTIVGLKGNPSWAEARIYASALESIELRDICTLTVGRVSEEIEDPFSTLFGDVTREGTPFFAADPWVTAFEQFFDTVDITRNRVKRNRSNQTWVIRGVCNVDKMFQRRISMADIAKTIEQTYKDYQVYYSNLKTGIFEVFYTGKNQWGEEGNLDSEYRFFSEDAKPNLESIQIRGLPGFRDAFIQKISVSSSLNTVRKSFSKKEKDVVIAEFNEEGILLKGIPRHQIIDFLALKARVRPEDIRDQGNGEYAITTREQPTDLRDRILTEETISFKSTILSSDPDGDGYIISFDRQKYRDARVNTSVLKSFIEAQGDLLRFQCANITFDARKLTVKIESDPNFGPQFLLEYIQRDNRDFFPDEIANAKSAIEGDTLILSGIPETVSPKSLRAMIQRFGTDQVNLSFDSPGNDGTVEVRLKVTPLSMLKVKDELLTTETGQGQRSDAIFTSEFGERYSHRFRIFVKGYGLETLATEPFVDMSITYSSHPPEMAAFFGIETARAFIFNELHQNSGGAAMSHNSLLADVLTYTGTVIAITKSGKDFIRSGVYARAAFSQTFKTFMEASVSSEVDRLQSSVSRTAIGDFERNDATRAKVVEVAPETLQSTMSMLMGESNQINRAGKKSRKPAAQKKTTAPKPEIDEILDNPDFAAPAGTL